MQLILEFSLIKKTNATVSVLSLTLIAIIWYSRETFVLRQKQWESNEIAEESNEIQEKPILNLYLRDVKDGPVARKLLKLRNVGRGSAYNVGISEFETAHVTYSPYFNQPNFILEAGGDEKPIAFNVEKHDGGYELFEDYARDLELFVDRIFPRDTNPEHRDSLSRTAAIFLITYEGVNKKSYFSIFRIYPKIWPSISVYEVVIEYVESGDGKCDVAKAKQICAEKELLWKG